MLTVDDIDQEITEHLCRPPAWVRDRPLKFGNPDWIKWMHILNGEGLYCSDCGDVHEWGSTAAVGTRCADPLSAYDYVSFLRSVRTEVSLRVEAAESTMGSDEPE